MASDGTDDNVKGPEQFLASLRIEKDEELERFLASMRPLDRFEHSFPDTTANRELVPEGRRRCPICCRPMQSQSSYQVDVDVCPAHGIWLDGNEVADFLHGYSKDSPANRSQRRVQYQRGYQDGFNARAAADWR